MSFHRACLEQHKGSKACKKTNLDDNRSEAGGDNEPESSGSIGIQDNTLYGMYSEIKLQNELLLRKVNELENQNKL